MSTADVIPFDAGERAEWSAARTATTLRAYADWLEAHPAATADLGSLAADHATGGLRVLDARPWTAEAIGDLAKQIGGRWTKRTDETYFWLVQEVTPGVEYQIYAARDAVCQRVVVGEEQVVVEEHDPEALAAVPVITRTETREVVEWRCPDSLLAK